MSILWTILTGAAAGFLAGQIQRGEGYGAIGNIVIGVAGGFIGDFLFGLAGFGTTGLLGNLISATVGAVLLLLFLFGGKRRWHRRHR